MPLEPISLTYCNGITLGLDTSLRSGTTSSTIERDASIAGDQEGLLPIVRTGVTVVVPAYNAELWLRDALDSVVTQSFQAHEIIVVDDGSHDRFGRAHV